MSTVLAAGLPEFCYSVEMTTGRTIRIDRGQRGFQYACTPRDADELNRELGVSPAQVQAMHVGSLIGWHVPGANPECYMNMPAESFGV